MSIKYRFSSLAGLLRKNGHLVNDVKKYFALARVFFKLIKPLNYHEKYVYSWSVFFMLLSILLNMFIPLTFKLIIDNLSSEIVMESKAYFLVVTYGIVWYSSQFSLHIREMIASNLIEGFIAKYTLDFVSKIKERKFFFELKDDGYILSLIERMQTNFHNLFLGIVFFVFPIIVELLIIVSAFALSYHVRYSIIIFFSISLFFLVSIILIIWYSNYYRKASYDKSLLSSSIHFYLQETKEKNNTSNTFEKLKNNILLNMKSQAAQFVNLKIIRLIQCTILGLGFCLIIINTIFDFLSQNLRVSDIVLINSYYLQLLAPLNLVALVLRDVARGLTTLGEMTSMNENFEDGREIESYSEEAAFN